MERCNRNRLYLFLFGFSIPGRRLFTVCRKRKNGFRSSIRQGRCLREKSAFLCRLGPGTPCRYWAFLIRRAFRKVDIMDYKMDCIGSLDNELPKSVTVPSNSGGLTFFPVRDRICILPPGRNVCEHSRRIVRSWKMRFGCFLFLEEGVKRYFSLFEVVLWGISVLLFACARKCLSAAEHAFGCYQLCCGLSDVPSKSLLCPGLRPE